MHIFTDIPLEMKNVTENRVQLPQNYIGTNRLCGSPVASPVNVPVKYKQGPGSSFQSAGADPPLLKCSGGSGVRLVGLWTFIMVYLVTTQYFLIQLQLINHSLHSLTNDKGVSNKKKCKHAQQHHNFRVFHSLSKFVLSLLAAV